MFERPRSGERALLIQLGIGQAPEPEQIEEFRLLAGSAGAECVGEIRVNLASARSRYLMGSGKVEEVAEQVHELCAELVLCSAALTPSQERNLEKRLKCRVLDRNGLILDIFAQRARSFEGKLQVELAQLRHLSTRLVRGWTHLERQKGGIGLRGPGESQLETDRRLIGDRISRLRKRLKKVDRQRDLGRSQRVKSETPVIALVGYTNAGKSTLFNALTDAEVYAADQLFATLDPTMRQLQVGRGRQLVLADTVGFVRDLPHELVAAFRSTLTETREADLILHVIDASDPHRAQRMADVNKVLSQLGAQDIAQIQVYNKIDLAERSARMTLGDDGLAEQIWVSAQQGDGLSLLRDALSTRFKEARAIGELSLAPAEGRLRAKLFQLGAVTSERLNDAGGWYLQLDMPQRQFDRFCAQEEFSAELLQGNLERENTTVSTMLRDG